MRPCCCRHGRRHRRHRHRRRRPRVPTRTKWVRMAESLRAVDRRVGTNLNLHDEMIEGFTGWAVNDEANEPQLHIDPEWATGTP